MLNPTISLLIGFAATAVISTPMNVEAATYDYSKAKNIPVRPIASNNILNLYGDLYQNEGYNVFSNVDPNAPDGGHFGIRINPIYTSYYAVGREANLNPSGATRSASVQNITGFSNLFNYLNRNNISPSSIGIGISPKSGRDVTKAWNLGEDILGQDWFSSPDSTIEEDIYRANPDDVEISLSYGTTKIIDLGYSPFYFISDNAGGVFANENWNIFLTHPTSPSKLSGLDPFSSGLADAFLKDVAAAGGSIQLVSEDQPEASDILPFANDKYQGFLLSFPIEIRAVKSVPEPSTGLGLLMLGALVTVSRKISQKQKQE
ncbi:hypothetical protein NIES4072_35200 [Nostoc commune NIES-4072]|uniref:Ice-binding protein C-terminal domain-containing protein n=1 Tax=Nostoc commune NIES-4072 TaxID=2005467 RepID=A0A2R5FVJ1_NOSCO|nr:PEP-CTERM sorting domain-containing protein [Nostoc commune]BBD69151.1 hypothetical protein NIES4070_55590 [Nostoc commune HK-02]GBG19851.1 hypothetical protein NIES4072_35200 [Nostoc commune NIES-4072]